MLRPCCDVALHRAVGVTLADMCADPLQAPSEWTASDVELWLIDAHDTRRRLHVAGAGHSPVRSSMLAPVHDPWITAINEIQLPGRRGAYIPPAPPSAASIARLDVVDGWFAWLDPPARWVVHLRAGGTSWRAIAQIARRDHGKRRSHVTYFNQYERALAVIVGRLAGA